MSRSLLILEDEPLAREIYKDALGDDFDLSFVETLKDLDLELNKKEQADPDILILDEILQLIIIIISNWAVK